MPTFDSDKAMTVLGVAGRLTHRTTKPGQAPGLWFNQKWISVRRPIKSYGAKASIRAEIRFDDECGNGHNTFAITADVYDPTVPGRDKTVACGCMHDDIAKVFPELAPLIKWHLTSSDGPMHYIANTLYHAGNRDHWGKLKGEEWQWEVMIQFGDNPLKHKPGCGDAFVKFLENFYAPHGKQPAYDYEVLPYYHDDHGKPGKYQFGPKYTFGGFAERWHECPFDTEAQAREFLYALQNCEPRFVRIPTAWGEGKERDLAAARESAVWPEATDEELCADPEVLRAALEKRHAGLMAEFRQAVTGAGFVWSPEAMKVEA